MYFGRQIYEYSIINQTIKSKNNKNEKTICPGKKSPDKSHIWN